VALRALHSLYSKRSKLDLVGNHIDTETGKWTAVDSGIGAGVDSYFEYLVKGGILLQRPELMHMFKVSLDAIHKWIWKNGWFIWATMGQGHVSTTTFQRLAFTCTAL
jgi:mannosidase alpha-like ER degradation enhancer 2